MSAILATGGAALAVNATVLDPQAESGLASVAAAAEAPSIGAPSVQSPGIDEFQIPGVGLVTLTTVEGQLVVQSVMANEGYTYAITESTPGEFEVRFESADQVVNFAARLVDGRIVTSATGEGTQPPVTQPGGGGSSGGGSAPGGDDINGDDDEYDDGYDDDGYDDDGSDHSNDDGDDDRSDERDDDD